MVLGIILGGLLGGPLVIRIAGARLWTTIVRWHHLVPVDGKVTGTVGDEPGSSSDSPAIYPVVQFTTSTGEQREFRSDIGSGSSSTYKVGMTLPVLYDPENIKPPVIDSWATIWLRDVVVLFLGLILFAFGIFTSYLCCKRISNWVAGDCRKEDRAKNQ